MLSDTFVPHFVESGCDAVEVVGLPQTHREEQCGLAWTERPADVGACVADGPLGAGAVVVTTTGFRLATSSRADIIWGGT